MKIYAGLFDAAGHLPLRAGVVASVEFPSYISPMAVSQVPVHWLRAQLQRLSIPGELSAVVCENYSSSLQHSALGIIEHSFFSGLCGNVCNADLALLNAKLCCELFLGRILFV